MTAKYLWVAEQYPGHDSQQHDRTTEDHRFAAAEPIGSRLMLRIVLPLHADSPGGQRLLQALYPVPNAIQPLTSGIEQAGSDFQRLKYLRGSLKLTFNIVLTFVLLLSALFAVVAAFGTGEPLPGERRTKPRLIQNRHLRSRTPPGYVT